jgi:hypothetical protein
MAYKTTTYSLSEHAGSTPIEITNNKSKIYSTNYWDTEFAQKGLCYLSGNAGDWRFLIPGHLTEYITEFMAVKRATIEPSIAIPGHIDIVSVDGSAAPYFIAISKNMIDRSIIQRRCRLLIYSPMGLINNVPVKVRFSA